MSGKIARLFAASMAPVAASGPGLMLPAERLEPPAVTARSADPGAFVPGADAVTFVPVGNALGPELGRLRMSASQAAFEHHQGSMTLEFAGTLPDFPGYRIASEFLAGASVYRVTNAEQYVLDNPAVCGGKPLKFLVMRFESLSDIRGGTMAVNLWLSSLDDYGQFGPSTVDPCGGDTYKAAKAE